MASPGDSSSDSDVPMRAALPIGEGFEEVDMDIPPATGMAFLRMVRNERKALPAVTVAHIDRSKVKVQTYAPPFPDHVPAPSGYAPSSHWQQAQCLSFVKVRQMLDRYRAAHPEIIGKNKALPHWKNAEAWKRLCLGVVEPREGTEESESTAEESAHSVDQSTEVKKPEIPASELSLASNQSNEGNQPRRESPPTSGGPELMQPLLSLVASIEQHLVDQIFEYHTDWLVEYGFSEHQGRWLYALLVAIGYPPHHETACVLRTMSRTCRKLRAELPTAEDSSLPSLNLLICLVGRFFENKDLADGEGDPAPTQ